MFEAQRKKGGLISAKPRSKKIWGLIFCKNIILKIKYFGAKFFQNFCWHSLAASTVLVMSTEAAAFRKAKKNPMFGRGKRKRTELVTYNEKSDKVCVLGDFFLTVFFDRNRPQNDEKSMLKRQKRRRRRRSFDLVGHPLPRRPGKRSKFPTNAAWWRRL